MDDIKTLYFLIFGENPKAVNMVVMRAQNEVAEQIKQREFEKFLYEGRRWTWGDETQ